VGKGQVAPGAKVVPGQIQPISAVLNQAKQEVTVL
jgi:hypothetical protein